MRAYGLCLWLVGASAATVVLKYIACDHTLGKNPTASCFTPAQLRARLGMLCLLLVHMVHD